MQNGAIGFQTTQEVNVPDRRPPSAVSLEGEVVEILQHGDVYTLRLILHHLVVFDMPPRLVTDVHLGDRIAIDGGLRVDGVRSLPDADPATRAV